MRPIQVQTSHTFLKALQCVQYRLPRRGNQKTSGYLRAVALRYGLMGMAATHQLLTEVPRDELVTLHRHLNQWPVAVANHFYQEVLPKLGPARSPALSSAFGQLAYTPVITYLALYPQASSFRECMQIAVSEFRFEHLPAIHEGWHWWRRTEGESLFDETAFESLRLAQLFAERLAFDLDEVPEIALLGE